MDQSELTKPKATTSRLTDCMNLWFLSVILAMPVIQLMGEISAQPSAWPTSIKLFPTLIRAIQNGFGSPSESFWQKGLAANSNICVALRTFENDVTTSAWPLHGVRDRLQAVLSNSFATGNEQVVIGQDGTLLFRPDVDALTAPGFLQPNVVRPGLSRSPRNSNPLPAIRQFAADLRTRGIDLMLLPIPSTASLTVASSNRIIPEVRRRGNLIHNVDFEQFLVHLTNPSQLAPLANSPVDSQTISPISIIDLEATFQSIAPEPPQIYLKTDTHWTPQGMNLAVAAVASVVRNQSWWNEIAQTAQHATTDWQVRTGPVIRKFGDTAALLGNATNFHGLPDEVTLLRIVDQNSHEWQPDPQAQILVLGDSFMNIYSQSELGWGTSAGFVEHLSHDLDLPLDRIAINAGGALASRAELLRQLQRDSNRLVRTRLIIWAFAERELTVGDWRVLPLPENHAVTQDPKRDEPAKQSPSSEVTGIVIQVGQMGDLQSMPYREALLPIHLKLSKPADTIESAEIVVYVMGLKNRRPTRAANIRVGQSLQLKLIPWSEVEGQYGRIARIELDDPDSVLLDLPTFWAEF